jgi:glycosyltransferase involved in cell wall biosynthesis
MKNKLRIFWLHPHFLNWMGGHEYVYEITSRLNKDFEVIVVADAFSAVALKKFSNIKIKTITLSGLSTNNPFYWLLLPMFAVRDCIKLRQICQPKDMIISSMFPMNLVAMLTSNKFIQLCYEPFAFFYDSNFVSGFPIMQRIFIYITKLLYSWVDIIATRKAQIVLTLSNHNRGLIRDTYRKDSIVVYEGVDTKFFRQKYDKAIEDKYKRFKTIFHSTDFTNIKGTEYLFKSMSFVKQAVPNVKLLISSTIQNSHQKAELINYAKSKNLENSIEFLGFLPYEIVPYYLSMVNIVVQPSIGQSMNLSVKEAMSCSTPAITSLEGGEQFSDGEAGFLVDPRDTKKLASRIVLLLKDKVLARKMGTKGVKIIKEKFNWPLVYKKIYNQIILVENEKE